MDMNEATSKALASERAIAALTIDALASKSGIPKRSLLRILGAERDIKVNQIAALAEALGVLPHEIIEHAESILGRSKRGRPNLIALPDPDA